MGENTFKPLKLGPASVTPATVGEVNNVQTRIWQAFDKLKVVDKLTSSDGSVTLSPASGIGDVDLSVVLPAPVHVVAADSNSISIGTTGPSDLIDVTPAFYGKITVAGVTYAFPLWRTYVLTPGPPLVGLKVWLKGDVGVTLSGSDVTSWADQSGFGYDHAQGGADPVAYEASPGINGVPCLVFAHNLQTGVENSTVPGGTAGSVVVIYERLTSAGSYSRVYDWFYPTNNDFISNNFNSSDTKQKWWAEMTGDGYPTSLGTTIAALMTWAPGDWKSYFKGGGSGGSLTTPYDSGVTSPTYGSGSRVGGVSNSGGQSANAKIAEVLRWDHALTGVELLQLSGYIATRYGL